MTFSADPTATLTGSTSAHAPLSAMPRTFQCFVADLPQVDQAAFGEVEQRGGQTVLRHALGADVLGLHGPETRRRRVLQREAG